MSANTLSKITEGLADNTITLILRATKFSDKFMNKFLSWIYHDLLNFGRKIQKSIFVCPAMNTWMFKHPVTGKKLDILKKWGFIIIEPIEKVLACNVRGIGAMENPGEILKKVLRLS